MDILQFENPAILGREMEVWWNVYLNASIIWRRTPFENIFNSKHGNNCFVTWNRFPQHYCVIDRKLANNYCISNKFWSWTCCCIPIKLKWKFNAVFISWGKINREVKQPQRRRQRKTHKFAYLTMKNRFFARFARAFVIFWHFEDVLVLSTTRNDLFCTCEDDVNKWWQMFNFVFLCPKRWFKINFRTVRRHFSSIMTLNNWKMTAEKRS